MEINKFFEKQWKLIVGVIGGAILISSLFVFRSMQSIQKEKLAQENYFSVEKRLLDLKSKKLNPQPDKKNEKSAVVDFTQSKIDLAKLIAEHPGTIASQMAAIHLAKLLVDEKKYEEALAELKKVENKDKGLVNTLVQQQIGQLLADNNKCEEAIIVWQKILDRKEASFIHNETKIQQALCYAKQNEFKKAEEILTNLVNQPLNRETGDNSSSKEAEKYLRLIQFKKTSGT